MGALRNWAVLVLFLLQDILMVSGITFNLCHHTGQQRMTLEEKKAYLITIKKFVSKCGSLGIQILAELPNEIQNQETTAIAAQGLCLAFRLCHADVQKT